MDWVDINSGVPKKRPCIFARQKKSHKGHQICNLIIQGEIGHTFCTLPEGCKRDEHTEFSPTFLSLALPQYERKLFSSSDWVRRYGKTRTHSDVSCTFPATWLRAAEKMSSVLSEIKTRPSLRRARFRIFCVSGSATTTRACFTVCHQNQQINVRVR